MQNRIEEWNVSKNYQIWKWTFQEGVYDKIREMICMEQTKNNSINIIISMVWTYQSSGEQMTQGSSGMD